MKKLFAMVLVLALSLSMCALGLAEAADGSVEKIKEKGTLVLGLDDTFPPMGFRDENNEIVGFDIDLARAVCERLGVELVCQPIDWASKELELSSGNVDCLWNGLSITEKRLEAMSMTEAYLNNKMVLVVKDKAIQTKADLAGKKLGLQAGSYAEEMLAANAEFKDSLGEVLTFEENLTALMDLNNGNLDAVLVDLVVATYQINNMENADLTIIEDLGDDRYGIGFRKEDVALRDAVNAILLEMDADGSLAEISTKWFGEDITIVKEAAAE